MKRIWLLEKPTSLEPTAPILQGAVALRLVASIDSFHNLIRIGSGENLPEIVLVNYADFSNQDIDRIRNGLSGITIVVIHNGSRVVESSGYQIVSANDIPFMLDDLNTDVTAVDGIRIDFETMNLILAQDDQSISLSLKEAKIIKMLLGSEDKVVSRQDLLSEVWQGIKVSRSTLDSHISRLRRKLDYTSVEIEGIYGGGYRLKI